MLVDVIRQQRLREIAVVEMVLAGQFEDLRPRGIHDLARPCRQPTIVGSLGIGLVHDLPGGVLDRDPLLARQSVIAAIYAGAVALLGLALLCPVLGDIGDRADDRVGDVDCGHWRAPGRIKAVLPRSLNCTRGEARCTTKTIGSCDEARCSARSRSRPSPSRPKSRNGLPASDGDQLTPAMMRRSGRRQLGRLGAGPAKGHFDDSR